MCVNNNVNEMNCYDIGFIRYGEMKDCLYKQIMEDVLSAFRWYSNEICLHPKYLKRIEVDSYFPQINIESISEDGYLSITSVERYNSSLLRNETNDSFLSTFAYLSSQLYKEFRDRASSIEYNHMAQRFPILILTDGDFLRVLSIIKENEDNVRMPYVLLGLANNTMVCYDSFNNSIDFIEKPEQIVDVILFNEHEDYSFPKIENVEKAVFDKEIQGWGDEEWL